MQLHQPCDKVVIGGAGLWTPEHVVTNEELVTSLNAYADQFNDRYADQIASGEKEAVRKSDVDFIVKASGIKQRHVYIKDGILDIDRMKPRIPERKDDELSHQAEVALHAARRALEAARKSPDDIDAVIVSCAYTERYYPAIAIEVQHALGIEGYAFDMLVACSAATFALHRAWEMVRTGSARSVLVINPELVTPQINFCDRDSHFIFGDVATAMVVERADDARGEDQFEILGAQAHTLYSNNIRSNFGYLSRGYDADPFAVDKLFHQEGRSVFKEVCPMAAQHLTDHLALHGFTPGQVRRWWLHQANINMNQLIAKRLLGSLPDNDVAPTVLDQYANTASAGSIIAFNRYHRDMKAGDIGMLCSFGAGYSIGSLLLRKT
ncbi:beta-ketoacyl-ACP synthase III [Pseudohongiella nitratireducens]|uniref:Beta-ketoacyl-ACP synthase III n=1 Tax=Pseudohongiella nitratireducens TaxID=1768907 RepID=A0A917GJE5_9GAMM|nr:beta-ketoacyl-ACP synthase III [Pseudohongiella nitratireducens]MDF1623853.1 beta-ketoacyl-ACP synthase III [Pseudohongiella nitratireducens]GGG48130.1 beta-ketoacyl-ACP synthase III [Pseudohongiella nitratireducens]|tara:strand:+ start:6098 stop:7237 length:1140 start_codon:yes stop_codon:yes gene_type:complete